MSTRMLIDARHSEETRVAIVRGNRVEEFDYESALKQQLKGNIYLAKVTRVEPSLQAAFVDYGGNRHGFLAFSEIHPDYYQIPVEDREALLEEERADADALEDDIAGAKAKSKKADPDEGNGELDGDEDDFVPEETAAEGDDEEEIAETIRDRRRKRSMRRRYKIQEVIKKRQILLVQVVKEERGTKGAALTTYLSLAGRYCVLMPNTTHSGGISRKISDGKDRKRLREILDSLDVPKGMGCIIRTAGTSRTKAEIKRDLTYMLRLWDDIRALTLKSIAPALVYEEGNLIKRTIRDLYDRSIDEVHVEGEEGFKTAREFMKLLMPSHTKKIEHYQNKIPLFQRYQVESQLEALLDPNVTLKSGGYLVINPTEALIAIDVNSGRSTKEHNIEETALKTNLEAAEEAARQLRLRDLAGLIVIDFIDMEVRSNNRKVERRLKEALKSDRARIQVGRLSNFGLLEMSRQRLRPNLLETNTRQCPHCEGTGRMRTVESAALHVLRGLEEEAMRGRAGHINLAVPAAVSAFILNQKRSTLLEIEKNYRLNVTVETDDSIIAPAYELKRVGAANGGQAVPPAVSPVITQDASDGPAEAREEPEEKDGKAGKRSRRRGGRGKRENVAPAEAAEPTTSESAPHRPSEQEDGDGEDKPKRRRRRGRRGGRRRRGRDRAPEGVTAEGAEGDTSEAAEAGPAPKSAGPADEAPVKEETAPEAKKPRRRRRKTRSDESPAKAEAADAVETAAEAAPEADDKDNKDKRPAKTPARAKTPAKADAAGADDKAKAEEKKPKRRSRKKPEDQGESIKAEAKPESRKSDKKDGKTEDKAEVADKKPGKNATAKKPSPRAKPAAKSPAKPKVKTEAKPEPEPAPTPVPTQVPGGAIQGKSATADESTKPKRSGWWNR